MAEITQSELRQVLNYDPDTGDFTWRVYRGAAAKEGQVAGGVNPKGYLMIRVNQRTYRAHRLAWLYMTGSWPDGQIDHRDQCKTNNRWRNLRLATNSENQINVTKFRARSGYKGVSKSGSRWSASICVRKRQISLGYFATAEDASAAYQAAVCRFFGEFAPTEFQRQDDCSGRSV